MSAAMSAAVPAAATPVESHAFASGSSALERLQTASSGGARHLRFDDLVANDVGAVLAAGATPTVAAMSAAATHAFASSSSALERLQAASSGGGGASAAAPHRKPVPFHSLAAFSGDGASAAEIYARYAKHRALGGEEAAIAASLLTAEEEAIAESLLAAKIHARYAKHLALGGEEAAIAASLVTAAQEAA